MVKLTAINRGNAMIRYLLPLALLVATAATAAPVCDGQLVTMRVSKLKPGGSMAGLIEAFKANAAWYKAKGLTDNSFAMAPVMLPVDGTMKPSVDQLVTLHVNGVKAPEHKDDAAWAAFVDKYKANSTIASETRMCLPKGTMLTVK